jgi:hypothetical protein
MSEEIVKKWENSEILTGLNGQIKDEKSLELFRCCDKQVLSENDEIIEDLKNGL